MPNAELALKTKLKESLETDGAGDESADKEASALWMTNSKVHKIPRQREMNMSFRASDLDNSSQLLTLVKTVKEALRLLRGPRCCWLASISSRLIAFLSSVRLDFCADRCVFAELCGCDACPDGFQVGNPDGLIQVTPSFLEELDRITLPPSGLNPEESTLADTLAALGYVVSAMIPCSFLDTVLESGL